MHSLKPPICMRRIYPQLCSRKRKFGEPMLPPRKRRKFSTVLQRSVRTPPIEEAVVVRFLITIFWLPPSNPTLRTRRLPTTAFKKEEAWGSDAPPGKEAEVFHCYPAICRSIFYGAWVKVSLGTQSHQSSARETYLKLASTPIELTPAVREKNPSGIRGK